jgi:hypothetical protein
LFTLDIAGAPRKPMAAADQLQGAVAHQAQEVTVVAIRLQSIERMRP